MNAIVLNMADYKAHFAGEDDAREQVARQIDRRVTVRTLAHAQTLAARLVREGIHPSVAAARAVSWALDAFPPRPHE